MLGQKAYEQIPHYGKCFDVAILPWKINKWTEAANPIKFKEYLALGKPVVSTPAFSELQRYLDVAYEAGSPEKFAECIRKAYTEDNAELVKKRRQRVAQNSWDSKAELLLGELFKEN
jgi:glycosyltransferase involved in cell wall biosynthesis